MEGFVMGKGPQMVEKNLNLKMEARKDTDSAVVIHNF